MTAEHMTPIPREARPYQGQRAGLVSRTIANVIDALVVGAVLLAGLVGINGLKFLVDPRTFQFSDASLLLSMTAAFVVLVLYFTAAWALTGRTYGDHVMGLRVVGRRGRRVRPLVALARAVFCALFPIGLGWCALSRSSSSVQDVVLRTGVIYDWNPHGVHGSPED